MKALCKWFCRQYWCLFRLRKAGFSDSELARVYRTILLPIVDYCAAVYHPMLTNKQDQIVERLQAQALRCIYGPYVPYAEMRRRAEVTTLRERRVGICDKFTYKCLTNDRFVHWFPLRQGRRGNSGGEKYQEEYVQCDRLRNTPSF